MRRSILLIPLATLFLAGCSESGSSSSASSPSDVNSSINDPTDLSSLALWLSADSNVLNASNAPASHGEQIAKWIGVGQNGRTIEFVPTTASNKPTYVTSGTHTFSSGVPSIFFNGWWGQSGGFNSTLTHRSDRTIFFVAKRTSLNNWLTYYDGPTNLSYGMIAGNFTESDPLYQYQKTDFYVATNQYKVGWADLTGYANNVYIGSRGPCSWNSNNPCEGFNGWISEVIVIDSIDASVVGQVNDYLESRYPGVTFSTMWVED